MRYRRKKFTFALSSPDELLLNNMNVSSTTGVSGRWVVTHVPSPSAVMTVDELSADQLQMPRLAYLFTTAVSDRRAARGRSNSAPERSRKAFLW